MSATYRCDRCGKNMSTNDHYRVRVKLGDWLVEVIHCNHGTWNAGHVCHKCVKEIVAKGKQEPR